MSRLSVVVFPCVSTNSHKQRHSSCCCCIQFGKNRFHEIPNVYAPGRSVLGRIGTARHLANLPLEVLRVREGAEGGGAPAPDLGEGSEGGGELRLQQRRALGSSSGGFGLGLALGIGVGLGSGTGSGSGLGLGLGLGGRQG